MSTSNPTKSGEGSTAFAETAPRQPGQVVFHLLILGLCAAGFGLTFLFDDVPPVLRRGMAPETFPRGVALLGFVLTAVSLLRHLRLPGTFARDLPPTFYFSLLASLVFLVVAMAVDLLLAMVAFVGAVTWLWGERRKAVVAALALVLPVVIFLLFSEMLGIRFPRGILVDVIYG